MAGCRRNWAFGMQVVSFLRGNPRVINDKARFFGILAAV
jgi:hypothetical protein